jgi:hypothetical protein
MAKHHVFVTSSITEDGKKYLKFLTEAVNSTNLLPACTIRLSLSYDDTVNISATVSQFPPNLVLLAMPVVPGSPHPWPMDHIRKIIDHADATNAIGDDDWITFLTDADVVLPSITTRLYLPPITAYKGSQYITVRGTATDQIVVDAAFNATVNTIKDVIRDHSPVMMVDKNLSGYCAKWSIVKAYFAEPPNACYKLARYLEDVKLTEWIDKHCDQGEPEAEVVHPTILHRFEGARTNWTEECVNTVTDVAKCTITALAECEKLLDQKQVLREQIHVLTSELGAPAK